MFALIEAEEGDCIQNWPFQEENYSSLVLPSNQCDQLTILLFKYLAI